KLVIISSMIGIAPLFALGSLSYLKSSSIVQEEVVAGNRLILEQNRQQVEMLLRTVDTLSTQMISAPVTTSDISVASVLNLPFQVEHSKLFESLIYKLIQIQVYELGISNVNLMSYRQNWLIDQGVVYTGEAA